MTRSSRITFLTSAALVALTTFAVAACGGGGGGGATVAPATPKITSGGPATIAVANSGLGKILVDAQGRTLYLFKKDSGTKSACFGECGHCLAAAAGGRPADRRQRGECLDGRNHAALRWQARGHI
jgi:predicted lipoprotein with Yx(FWY)xxD motif